MLISHLEALLSTDRDTVQGPEPQAPVDDVGPVVPLPLRLLGLLDAGVGRQAELLQPGQVGDVGQVPQLGQLVVGEGQAGQAAGQVRAALAEMRRRWIKNDKKTSLFKGFETLI